MDDDREVLLGRGRFALRAPATGGLYDVLLGLCDWYHYVADTAFSGFTVLLGIREWFCSAADSDPGLGTCGRHAAASDLRGDLRAVLGHGVALFRAPDAMDEEIGPGKAARLGGRALLAATSDVHGGLRVVYGLVARLGCFCCEKRRRG